ncbi:uncharacterized protein [Apostichopus japonicus]|uniref:uncharacterized protein isoform X2 n=1 Tax=Stichopus japonicus TaxID=307972 RepID=UPI003AB7E185
MARVTFLLSMLIYTPCYVETTDLQFLWCVHFSWNTTTATGKYVPTNLSPKTCSSFCDDQSNDTGTTFGLSGGNICLCIKSLDVFNDTARLDDIECKADCKRTADTDTEYCGKSGTVAVYLVPNHSSQQSSDCPSLSKLDNGVIHFEWDRVYLTCNDGYQLTGDDMLECNQNGDIWEWQGTPPTCKETATESDNDMRGNTEKGNTGVLVAIIITIIVIITAVVVTVIVLNRKSSCTSDYRPQAPRYRPTIQRVDGDGTVDLDLEKPDATSHEATDATLNEEEHATITVDYDLSSVLPSCDAEYPLETANEDLYDTEEVQIDPGPCDQTGFDESPSYKPIDPYRPVPSPRLETTPSLLDESVKTVEEHQRISNSYVIPNASVPAAGNKAWNNIDDGDVYDWANAKGSEETTADQQEYEVQIPRRFQNMDISEIVTPKYTRVSKETSVGSDETESQDQSRMEDVYLTPI